MAAKCATLDAKGDHLKSTNPLCRDCIHFATHERGYHYCKVIDIVLAWDAWVYSCRKREVLKVDNQGGNNV